MKKIKKGNHIIPSLRTILKSKQFKKNYLILNHSLFAPKDTTILKYFSDKKEKNKYRHKSKSFSKDDKQTSKVKLSNEINVLFEKYSEKQKKLIEEFKTKEKENLDFSHSFDLMKKFNKHSNILFSNKQINYMLSQYLKQKKLIIDKKDINRDILSSDPLLMIEPKELNFYYILQESKKNSLKNIPQLKEVKFIKKIQYQNELNGIKYDEDKKKKLSFDSLIIRKDNKSFNDESIGIDNFFENKQYISKIKNSINKLSKLDKDIYDNNIINNKSNYLLFRHSASAIGHKYNNMNNFPSSQKSNSNKNLIHLKKNILKKNINDKSINVNKSVKFSSFSSEINQDSNEDSLDDIYKKAKNINRENKKDVNEVLQLFLKKKGLKNINKCNKSQIFSFIHSIKLKSKMSIFNDSLKKIYSTNEKGIPNETFQNIKKEETLNKQMDSLDSDYYKCLLMKNIKK